MFGKSHLDTRVCNTRHYIPQTVSMLTDNCFWVCFFFPLATVTTCGMFLEKQPPAQCPVEVCE